MKIFFVRLILAIVVIALIVYFIMPVFNKNDSEIPTSTSGDNNFEPEVYTVTLPTSEPENSPVVEDVPNVSAISESVIEEIISGDNQVDNYYGYTMKVITEDTYYVGRDKGNIEFSKDNVTFYYNPSTKCIDFVELNTYMKDLVIPSKIGEYDVEGVNYINIGSEQMGKDLHIKVEDGVKIIGAGFTGDFDEFYPGTISVELPNSIEKVYDNLYDVDVTNMPSKEKIIINPAFTTIKIEENLYLIQDFTEDFWGEYKATNENMEDLQKLLKNEIDNYIEVSKKYSHNNANKNIIVYIRIAYDGDNWYHFYTGRFSNEDNEKDLAEAVVYFMRSKYPKRGNGGFFPRHDEDETLNLRCPFYDKEVTASGAVYQFEYDRENNSISELERLYPGEV